MKKFDSQYMEFEQLWNMYPRTMKYPGKCVINSTVGTKEISLIYDYVERTGHAAINETSGSTIKKWTISLGLVKDQQEVPRCTCPSILNTF